MNKYSRLVKKAEKFEFACSGEISKNIFEKLAQKFDDATLSAALSGVNSEIQNWVQNHGVKNPEMAGIKTLPSGAVNPVQTLLFINKSKNFDLNNLNKIIAAARQLAAVGGSGFAELTPEQKSEWMKNVSPKLMNLMSLTENQIDMIKSHTSEETNSSPLQMDEIKITAPAQKLTGKELFGLFSRLTSNQEPSVQDKALWAVNSSTFKNRLNQLNRMVELEKEKGDNGNPYSVMEWEQEADLIKQVFDKMSKSSLPVA